MTKKTKPTVDDILEELKLNIAEIHDDMRDPQYRRDAIVKNFDIIFPIAKDDSELLQSLADCCVPDVTAAEIALALSGTHRWRMTDDEIELLEALIESNSRSTS